MTLALCRLSYPSSWRRGLGSNQGLEGVDRVEVIWRLRAGVRLEREVDVVVEGFGVPLPLPLGYPGSCAGGRIRTCTVTGVGPRLLLKLSLCSSPLRVVRPLGIEPRTHGLKARCSAN